MPCAVRHDQQVQAGGPALGLEYDGPDFDRSAVREQVIPGHVIGGQGLEPAKTLDGLPIVGDDSFTAANRSNQQPRRPHRIGGQKRTEHVLSNLEDEMIRVRGAHGGNVRFVQRTYGLVGFIHDAVVLSPQVVSVFEQDPHGRPVIGVDGRRLRMPPAVGNRPADKIVVESDADALVFEWAGSNLEYGPAVEQSSQIRPLERQHRRDIEQERIAGQQITPVAD